MESRTRVLVKMQKEVMGWRQIEAIRKHKPGGKKRPRKTQFSMPAPPPGIEGSKTVCIKWVLSHWGQAAPGLNL